jgi:RNA polymerase sigma-70 factor (ECF subfamily)
LVEHYFRHESSRLVATLVRAFGTRHLGLVEDVVQSALLRALSSWSLKGVPVDPRAWLARVARNLVIDALRRDLRWNSLEHSLPAADAQVIPLAEADDEVHDALLRMIFVCCDDAVPPESQVALALKTLCGFDVREIARALLTTEANIAKRLTRAREKLRTAGLDPSALTPALIQSRVATVLAVIYLLFNEGYSSSQPDHLIRTDLCEEAVRLALILAEHPLTQGPETAAFIALLLLHASRLDARQDAAGSLLLLEDQDRSLWDPVLMGEGFRWLTRAACGDRFTRYHAEAWITGEHCRARSFRDTNWDRIVQAYDLLVRIAPSPIHELNRAIAVAERDGADAGWAALQAIDADRIPRSYHLWAATAGELSRRRGRKAEARQYFEQALQTAPTKAEQDLLTRRLKDANDL